MFPSDSFSLLDTFLDSYFYLSKKYIKPVLLCPPLPINDIDLCTQNMTQSKKKKTKFIRIFYKELYLLKQIWSSWFCCSPLFPQLLWGILVEMHCFTKHIVFHVSKLITKLSQYFGDRQWTSFCAFFLLPFVPPGKAAWCRSTPSRVLLSRPSWPNASAACSWVTSRRSWRRACRPRRDTSSSSTTRC